MGRFGLFQAGYSRCIVGSTIEVKSAPSSPSRSPTACRFKSSHLASRVSQGERRVSEGRAPRGSRACSPSIDGSQNGLPSLRYFGLPLAQPLRLALVDPIDRYLRAWKPVPSCLQFDQQRVLSRFFSLPLPPPSFQRPPSPPSWRNEKPRLRSWELEPNPM